MLSWGSQNTSITNSDVSVFVDLKKMCKGVSIIEKIIKKYDRFQNFAAWEIFMWRYSLLFFFVTGKIIRGKKWYLLYGIKLWALSKSSIKKEFLVKYTSWIKGKMSKLPVWRKMRKWGWIGYTLQKQETTTRDSLHKKTPKEVGWPMDKKKKMISEFICWWQL